MNRVSIGYWTVAVLSVLVGLVSLRFLGLGLGNAFESMDGHIQDRVFIFILHISASPVALILGAPQFSTRLRLRWPGLHRWTGRLYVMAILIGGVSGFLLAMGSWERPAVAMGFGLLSVLWIGFTLNALRLIRAGQRTDHQRWMIRSFALTFAAVLLRLQLPVFMAFGMDYLAASPYLAWMCWVPCLIAGEWVIRRRYAGRAVV